VARAVPILLGLYLALKIGDITLRGVWGEVSAFTPHSFVWLAEILLGVVAPMVLLSSPRVRASANGLLAGASLVVLGVAFNRINVFIVAYKPLYADRPYYPSIFEIALTVGLISALVLVYRLMVMIFPVIASESADRADEVEERSERSPREIEVAV
jgi:Ni/Fe-hydrogenase subunit HybB-like protein